MKKKKIFIILTLILIMFIMFFSYNNLIKKNQKFFNNKEKYKFGDKDILSDDINHITLYSENIWKKVYSINEGTELVKNILNKYGIEYYDIRTINEEELKLCNCYIQNLTCKNPPNWINSGITEIVSEKVVIVYDKINKKFNNIPITELDLKLKSVEYTPVITISKKLITS